MSYTYAATETYSVADIEVVMRRVTADLVMIASSTGAITSDFKVTARPAAVALGALTMAGRNNQDVMAR